MTNTEETSVGAPPEPGMVVAACEQDSSSEKVEIKDEAFDQANCNRRPPLNPLWTQCTNRLIHRLVPKVVTSIALMATRRPRITLCAFAFFSLGLAILGYSTNFKLDVEQFEAYAPYEIRPRSHRDWIEGEAGFPPDKILFLQIVHTNGDNVITVEGIHKVFQGYHAVYNLDGYEDFCAQSNYEYNDKNTCQVSSVLRFWNYNESFFEETVQTDEDVMAVLLKRTYPDGTPVDIGAVLGNYQATTDEKGVDVITAQSFVNAFFFPAVEGETSSFEVEALEASFPVRNELAESGNQQPFRLEVMSEVSYPMEFARAIGDDLVLVPLAFLLMTVFTCIIFFRRHPVESRLLLGLAAVVTILCSLLAGELPSPPIAY